ncbi:MAG TPA: hypothetical protein VFX84_01285 [Candidatus Saccharimonadales bacterium]|nr:hypothetical protein [Candidatus Saccharimonadales bacterium]
MRYVIGLIVTLGLMAVLIVMLMSGGEDGGSPPRPKTLTDYAKTDSQVSMTIDGPVNADSLHDQVRVTVDRTNVTYEHIKGYQGDVVNTKLFANNDEAYDVFLHALLHAGYSLGDDNPALEDERGWCPTGNRYIFELIQDGKTLKRYWDTTCNNPKTYEGNTSLTITLFQTQVPGYDDLTEDIGL